MKCTKVRVVVLLVVSVALVSPAAPAVRAQAQAPVTSAARAAAQTAAPTGPMTATTRTAAAVRSSRAAHLAASRGATATGAAAGTRATSVVGYLWTANNSVITDATVQLRNTVTGQIEMYTLTNQVGEFTFNNVPAGSFVIEYASEQAGSVLALGHPFTVAPGETVATFVRMSSALPIIIPDFTGNLAASVLQAAASSGIPPIVTPLPPVVEPPPPPPPPSSGVR